MPASNPSFLTKFDGSKKAIPKSGPTLVTESNVHQDTSDNAHCSIDGSHNIRAAFSAEKSNETVLLVRHDRHETVIVSDSPLKKIQVIQPSLKTGVDDGSKEGNACME
eukprot:740678_1